MEKLSKSLQDGRKLAAGESYQDLRSTIEEEHTVKYQNADKHSSRLRQRPKSLNFEIFLNELEQGENKTDDEKTGDGNGELDKEKGQILNFEMASQVLPTVENELPVN